MLNAKKSKKDFPIFKTRVNCYPLIYLDNAATTQKPKMVIDAISKYYEESNANVHRSAHYLAAKATDVYENARNKMLDFIGGYGYGTIAFTRNTTEAINMLSFSLFYKDIVNLSKVERSKNIIITTYSEHHSNFLPWQRLAKDFGFTLLALDITKDGKVNLEELANLLNKYKNNVKLVTMVHVSNVLGTINNIKEAIFMCHKYDIPVLIDAAQSIGHMPINVKDLDVDFLAFSGHKMYGPMGIGGLYIKENSSTKLSPFLVGGGNIQRVMFDKTVYADLPDKLESGTPNVAGAAGLIATIDYLTNLGMDNIFEHEQRLMEYAINKFLKLDEIKVLGSLNPSERSGLISFVLPNKDYQRFTEFMNENGIAIRTGHHCAQVLHNKLGLSASARISFGLYNTEDDVDMFFDVLSDYLFRG